LNAAKPTMGTGEARIKSLYTGLYRTIIRLGLLIAAAWLFAAFSLYLSRKTGTDWFSRSALKEELVSVSREIELHLKPPKSYMRLLYLGYLTGIVGTGIWGYGDLLVRLIF
jgi:hypothetical protein